MKYYLILNNSWPLKPVRLFIHCNNLSPIHSLYIISPLLTYILLSLVSCAHLALEIYEEQCVLNLPSEQILGFLPLTQSDSSILVME